MKRTQAGEAAHWVKALVLPALGPKFDLWNLWMREENQYNKIVPDLYMQAVALELTHPSCKCTHKHINHTHNNNMNVFY